MQVAKDPIEQCLLELLLKIMIGQENDVKFDEKVKHGSSVVNVPVLRDFPRITGIWRKCSVLSP